MDARVSDDTSGVGSVERNEDAMLGVVTVEGKMGQVEVKERKELVHSSRGGCRKRLFNVKVDSAEKG